MKMQAQDLTTLPFGWKKLLITRAFILNPVQLGVCLIYPRWCVMALSVFSY